MLLIKNGRVIDPKTNTDQVLDILIKDQIIIKRGIDLESEIKDNGHSIHQIQTIDAKGLVVMPGLVDVHVHFRDPGFTHKEDIYSGAKAAARGGYTTVILMANTNPCVDNVDTLEYVIKKGGETEINVKTCACITKELKGKELVDFDLLYEKGAVGFTDDGIPLLDKEILSKALEKAKELNVPISLHEENPAFIINNGIDAGSVSRELGVGGSSRTAEIDLIKRDVKLACEIGAPLNVQHISTKEGVQIIREAKKQWDCIHAEATPHHFSLTSDAVLEYKSYAKMNPPLREQEDLEAIIQGIKDGTIDMIATDHAPHTKEEKTGDITKVPSGIIGLETALPLAITKLVKPGHLNLLQLAKRMSYAPAAFYHLNRGGLAEGDIGDLVIFDMDKEVIFTDFLSKSSNTPFANTKMNGKVCYTIVNGKVVYQD